MPGENKKETIVDMNEKSDMKAEALNQVSEES
jgi:hypothetical protein